jgi:uncharacterized protein (TIGR02391 family)
MAAVRKFTENELMALSKVLGDTASGMTGSEIGSLLATVGFRDPGPITKRDRLFEALRERQARDNSGNSVANLILQAMDPIRYRGHEKVFRERRHELNVVLAFAGLAVREDGKLEAVAPASTLSEAAQRASRLRSELMRRGISGDVLRFCQPELLDGDYFHAAFEATKSIAQKLRERTGLTSDGSRLVEEALGIENDHKPLLAWNTLATDNEKSEHRGVVFMVKGVFAYFRNLPAHVPHAFRTVNEEEALELLTIASFIHRRLDAAVSTNPSRLHG